MVFRFHWLFLKFLGSGHRRFFVLGGTGFVFSYFQKRKAAGIAKICRFSLGV